MICKHCRREPHEIPEYVKEGEWNGIEPWQFVIENEGTYDPDRKTFCCTDCYIKKEIPKEFTGEYPQR